MLLNDRDQIIAMTAEWTGERYPNGRPRVSDEKIEILKNLTQEEIWQPLYSCGYRFQFQGDLKPLHPDKKLYGRAVTCCFMPQRPDLRQHVFNVARSRGWKGDCNQWVIDSLEENDVVVCDLYDKILRGTFVGGNLTTAVKARTKNGGVVVWGGVRDLEQMQNIDVQVFYRGVDPTPIRDCQITAFNGPCRIGAAICLPGDIVIGTKNGILFVPSHMVDYVIEHAYKSQVRDLYAFPKLEAGIYTTADVDAVVWNDQMMQALHQLSFFSLNVHGTRAEIIVRERDAIPDLRPENIPGNVVAAASGEITHIEPWAGDALVQEGDGVAAGDVLISGAMEMDTSNPLELVRPKRLVHAEGKVLASTRRTLTACLDLTAQGKRYTGEETTRYALSILGKRVKFFRNSGISYANYDTITKLKSWTPPLGDCLPIVWEAETFRAYDPVEQPLDAAAAEALLQAQLRKALEEALGQGEILTTRYETTQEGDRLFVTLTAHCFEDIAKEVPMTADEIAQIRAASEPPPTEEKPAKE